MEKALWEYLGVYCDYCSDCNEDGLCDSANMKQGCKAAMEAAEKANKDK